MKTDMPLVSVIIPVYNTEKYVKQCLDSIIGQTLKDIEIICVDDGSTDDSLNILREYAQKDQRIKILTQKNLYAGVARNAGMDVARGKYYVFLDSDDFFEPNLLQLQYDQCEKYSADIGLCSADCFQELEKKFVRADWFLSKRLIKKQPFNRELLGDELFLVTGTNPWTKMFSAEFIHKHQLRFQDLPRANDVYFSMVSLALADRIVAVDKVLVHYRTGMVTNLQANNALSPLSFCEALVAVKQKLQEQYIFDNVEISFIRNVISQCIYNLKKLSSNTDAHNLLVYELKNTYLKEFGIDLYRPNRLYCTVAFNQLKDEVLHSTFPKRAEPIKEVELQGPIPCVTVIIPVYNVEKYLRECLDSIIVQTLTNIEIICVNDGSTDSSPDILQEYAEKDQRIKIITQLNQGLSAARNSGLLVARGEFVYFIDSDDYLEKDALKYLYLLSKVNKLDAVFFDLISFEDRADLNIKLLPSKITRHEYSDIYDGVSFMHILRKDKAYITSACLILLNRDFLLQNNISFYRGILHEDELFCFLVLMDAKRVTHVGKKYYYRRVRENSIMTTPKTEKNAKGYFICLREMFRYALRQEWGYEKSEEIRRSIEGMQRAVKGIYKQLSPAERKFSIEDPISDMIFENFISNSINVTISSSPVINTGSTDQNIAALERKIKSQQATIYQLIREIEGIHASVTYKVGRFITWLPRNVRGCVRCYQEHGFRYTLWRIREHFRFKTSHSQKETATKSSSADNTTDKQSQTVQKQASPQKVKKDYNFYRNLSPDKYADELALWYKRVTKQELDLLSPQTFNEKIQWLKLYDSTPIKTSLADKYLVRDWIKNTIGEKYLIPLLGVWDKFEDIDFESLPNQFVLKANHGCGWNIIVRDKSKFNYKEAKEKFDTWMHKNYAFAWGLELQYMNIPPKIIAEKYIAGLDGDIYDYRFFCFNGDPMYIWLDVGSGTPHHKRNIYDLEWNLQNYKVNYPQIIPYPPKPDTLEEMINCVKKLCKEFAFVRVDFYSVNGHVYFGEMTFTSQSGVGTWEDEEQNKYYGSLINLPPKSPIPERKVF